MTDAEIVALVARAIGETDSGRWADHNTPWQYMDEDDQHWYGVLASAVVAALTEAGRLLPPGMVCVEMEREDLLP